MKRHRSRGELKALLSPLGLLVLLVSTSSLAGTHSSASPGSTTAAAKAPLAGNDLAAMRLLQRAEKAPSTTAYHGVQFVSAWAAQGTTGAVVDVNHRPDLGTAVRIEGNAQTPARTTHLPVHNTEPSLAVGSSGLSLLAANYSLSLAGTRSVAGRPADVVEVRRHGTTSPAARFWLDQETGLVLRREVYDERGRATRASAFVEVEVGRAAPVRSVQSRMPSAWPHAVARSEFAAIRAKGWHCPDRVAQTLTLVDARRGGSREHPILHLSFSDGLSAVSLFQQRGHLDSAKLDGYRRAAHAGGTIYVRDGVPTRWVWGADGMVFTVVADAPERTVEKVVEALPPPDSPRGAWGRLSRGMDRVASWFNPFG